MTEGVDRVLERAREEAALDGAISVDRLSTYLRAADGDRVVARALYLWDRDLAMALLADIAILEVAMRNAMHDALSASWGARWYESEHVALDDRSLGQLRRAWEGLPAAVRRDRSDPRLPGRLVARCMFGFWANLLDAGGHVGGEPRRRSADYEDLWRSTLSDAFAGGRREARASGARYSRPWAHAAVAAVNVLRNRVAHHEPLVNGIPFPGQGSRMTISQGYEACRRLARMLDRDLARWLDHASAVPAVVGRRPHG